MLFLFETVEYLGYYIFVIGNISARFPVYARKTEGGIEYDYRKGK